MTVVRELHLCKFTGVTNNNCTNKDCELHVNRRYENENVEILRLTEKLGKEMMEYTSCYTVYNPISLKAIQSSLMVYT